MGEIKVDRRLVAGMTKRERQAFVREVRRRERERIAREKKRRRIVGWSSAAAGAVAVGIIGAVVITNGVNAAAAEAAAGPANMLSDGLLIESAGDGSTTIAATTTALAGDEQPVSNFTSVASSGVLDLQIYLDLTTSDAATFWTTNGATIESFVAGGSASVELHPVAMDTSNDEGVAAVAAFGCIADVLPDSAISFWDAMAAKGVTNAETGLPYNGAELPSIVSNAGIDDESVSDCLDASGFSQWAIAASGRAAASIPYVGTADVAYDVTVGPVIVAAGTVFSGALDDADAFTTFLSDTYAAQTETTGE